MHLQYPISSFTKSSIVTLITKLRLSKSPFVNCNYSLGYFLNSVCHSYSELLILIYLYDAEYPHIYSKIAKAHSQSTPVF